MKNENKNTVVVAMSGGVDSSVAAALLKEKGYNTIGITMKTWEYEINSKESGCCSMEAINNARNVASFLGIPHYTLDFTEFFNKVVVENFIDEYIHGRTPNPCVLCNKEIKWGVLMDKAELLGTDYLATGHYAQIMHNDSNKRYYITTSEDSSKDQSYALWRLSQKALSKTMFPIGTYTKDKIRLLASKLNLKTHNVPDSQEICFVPNNNYKELLQIKIPDFQTKYSNGDILYKGNIVGKHNGFPNYTIGQRRGLNIALGHPVYVSKIDAVNNVIYVSDEQELYNTEFIVKEINLMLLESIPSPTRARIKIRYKDSGDFGTIQQIDETTIKIIFEEPKKSITPGQSAVFYDNEKVIGGGIIDQIIK
jgi:tRNA-uridine 2-sulfurtransferase